MIYANVLNLSDKRSPFQMSSEFLVKTIDELCDVYRTMDVMGEECDFIQSEVYKNSSFLLPFLSSLEIQVDFPSLKTLEQNVLMDFECHKFFYYSDYDLASDDIRFYIHLSDRVTLLHSSSKIADRSQRMGS